MASPFCCCLAHGEAGVVEDREVEHACCQVADVEVPVQEEKIPCECEGADVMPGVVVKTLEVERTSWDLVNEVEWVVEAELVFPGAEKDLLSGSWACVQSARDMLTAHCVLLL